MPTLFQRKTQEMGAMGGRVTTYDQNIYNYFGSSLIADWSQDDQSGAAMVDKSAKKRNGSYTNATLAQPGIGDGKTSVKYPATAYGNIYSAGLNTDFTPGEFTLNVFAKMNSSAEWSDGLAHTCFGILADTNNYVRLGKSITNGRLQADYVAGGTSKTQLQEAFPALDFMNISITVSKSNDRLRMYIDGRKILADITGLGTWTGNLISYGCGIGGRYGTSASQMFYGWIAKARIINRETTLLEQIMLSNPFGNLTKFIAIGDSKSDTYDHWMSGLVYKMRAAGRGCVQAPPYLGISGATTADQKARCDADISAITIVPDEVLINLGANDMGTGHIAAGWETNTRYIVNAYHAAFPNANIRLTKIWKRAFAVPIAEANAVIDTIYADYGWMKPGINEALFLEGGDDGATYTVDGTHPNAAGHDLEAAAWKAVIYP